ncbi:MAG: 2-oxoacid:ferredoxin oxidoreductase subunit beta [Candidatus Dormibacteria bacterium]
MPSITKPLIPLLPLARNELGLTLQDYQGGMSTLCAGCGHDSITAALIDVFWQLSLPPHMIAKLSGIGCSSKTPAYFVSRAHGFNSVHGRMATIATGASAANRELLLVGVSGDGDSLSIGLGNLAHAIRRNVKMVYLIENNGVYGLTKGQFSASADVGSRSRRGVANLLQPVDPILLGLSLGATFLARGFSGDKGQLIPILKAAVAHRGFALVDVISPCVQFNDHEGSTKSYRYMRDHELREIEADFISEHEEIVGSLARGRATEVTMHDGGTVRFRAVPDGYDPRDRGQVEAYLRERTGNGEIVTGLLYVDESSQDMHELAGTPAAALSELPFSSLCPGAAELEHIQESFR